MRGGVAPSRVYLPPGAWTTLLDFLTERFRHVEPSILRARLERGEIVDESGMPQAPDSSYLARSEEHTSELQSLMRISYAVFCLKKKKTKYIDEDTEH